MRATIRFLYFGVPMYAVIAFTTGTDEAFISVFFAGIGYWWATTWGQRE